MTVTLSCETADSHTVLEAARAAMPADPASRFLRPAAAQELTARQRPLVPLLMALLDCTVVTAKAIDDNAWDEGTALAASLVDELIQQCDAIRSAIDNASHAHDVNNWSLPSMTGKELV
jgi:hypothetical protein